MIPVGLAISSNVLVGNYIGANKIDNARFYAKICFVLALIWAIATVGYINIAQDLVIDLFSEDVKVKHLIHLAWASINVFVFFDCL